MKEFNIYPLPEQILIEVDQYDEFSNGLLIALHNRPWNAVKLFEWRNIAQVSVVKKFVTPNAFQYFVPSLLLGSIREPEFLNYGLEAILPNNQKRIEKGDWWFDFRARFSNGQVRVVQEFLFASMYVCSVGSEEAAMIDTALTIWGVEKE